jgi:hypothetical protein
VGARVQPARVRVRPGALVLAALADYSTVFGGVKGMRLVPFRRPALVAVAVAAALPMIALLLVVIPLPKLLGQLAKALL